MVKIRKIKREMKLNNLKNKDKLLQDQIKDLKEQRRKWKYWLFKKS